jgi:hypothetical protein
MDQDINLSSIFKEVTKVLAENQQELDAADDYNHNHGSNMVNTFGLLQKAVDSVKDQPVSDQLKHASQTLREQSTSGTAQMYADGLAQASKEFVGKELNANTAGTLINSMMGMGETPERGGGDFLSALIGNLAKPKQEAEPAPSQPDDLLGSLIGGLTGQQEKEQAPAQPDDLLGSLLGGLGGQQQQAQPEATPQAGSDLLGSLLGGLGGQKPSSGGIGDLISSLLGKQSGSSQGLADGVDAKDLISMALAYYAAKQKGKSSLEAIMQALSSSSPFGKRRDQTQSGALVVNTILNMLGNR